MTTIQARPELNAKGQRKNGQKESEMFIINQLWVYMLSPFSLNRQFSSQIRDLRDVTCTDPEIWPALTTSTDHQKQDILDMYRVLLNFKVKNKGITIKTYKPILEAACHFYRNPFYSDNFL